MTRNNVEQFNKSSPSLIFCFLWIAGEPLQYLVQAAGGFCCAQLSWLGWRCSRESQCLSLLPQITPKHLANHFSRWLGMHTYSGSLGQALHQKLMPVCGQRPLRNFGQENSSQLQNALLVGTRHTSKSVWKLTFSRDFHFSLAVHLYDTCFRFCLVISRCMV